MEDRSRIVKNSTIWAR